MKNKTKVFRIASLLLVLCFISTVMISGTFAKYTSEYAGQDTALVARWSFGGFVGQDPEESSTELDLFKHEYDTYINQTDGAENAKYIIAPGVEGEFVVAMDYLADVAADVEIAVEGLTGNALVPIEYSVDGGDNWVVLGDLAGALVSKIDNNVTAGSVFRIPAVDSNSTTAVEINKTVLWRWAYDKAAQDAEGAGTAAFESVDSTDTALGEASADGTSRTSYGIKITVTATQVMPETTGTTP